MDAKKPDNDKEDEEDNDNEEDIDNDLLLKKEKEEKLQQRFIECLNSFNTNAINECIKYLDKLPFEVIDYVLSRTSGIKYPNWNYADTILQDYVRRKIDTVEKIQADEIGFKSQKQDTSKVVDFQMNKDEFKRQISKIQTAYNKIFTKEEMTVWYEEFKNTDKTEFETAIERTIQEVKFIPKIADIRARIAVNPIDYYVKDPYRYLYKNLEWGEFID